MIIFEYKRYFHSSVVQTYNSKGLGENYSLMCLNVRLLKKKQKQKKKRTVIVLSRYDRSKHKERTATSFQMSVKKSKERSTSAFWAALIRKSVDGERQALKGINAFKFF